MVQMACQLKLIFSWTKLLPTIGLTENSLHLKSLIDLCSYYQTSNIQSISLNIKMVVGGEARTDIVWNFEINFMDLRIDPNDSLVLSAIT